MNALDSYVAYIGQTCCPMGLAAFYPFPLADAALALEGRRRDGGGRGNLGGRAGLAAGESLPGGRVALVSGHVGAGDRVGAGGRAGDGRPLHLFTPDRAVAGGGLGSGRFRPLPARFSSRRRRGGRAGGGGVGGLCLPADVVFARQPIAVGAHPEGHLAQRPGRGFVRLRPERTGLPRRRDQTSPGSLADQSAILPGTL